MEGITHVSKTRVSHSVCHPISRDPPSEDTVASLVVVVVPIESDGDGNRCIMGKRKANPGGKARKRRKPDAPTLMRRWQEVWAYKFAWAEGEFDANGNLTGVICQSCMTITGRRKILVPKLDNLEKQEGKQTCSEDGVPFIHLRKGNTFFKRDCKHVLNCKLWASRKPGCTVADQLHSGMEGEFMRKGDVKVCQQELACMFIDRDIAFGKQDFPLYTDLVSVQCNEIPMRYCARSISGIGPALSSTRAFGRLWDNLSTILTLGWAEASFAHHLAVLKGFYYHACKGSKQWEALV